MKRNIVIFGGAFDPIHNGHINMALNAAKSLNAEVYFVPARISVWKSKTTPVEDKINMIELAIKDCGSNKLKIDRYEIDNNQDTTYSIDTVKYFIKKYVDANLFLLIGTDQVNNFHKWKEASEIAKLAQIVYFPRKGLTLDSGNIDKFHMKEIDGDISDTSSTDIRELKSLDTPLPVINYIVNNELYFINKVKGYLSHKRYLHSLSVAKLAYEIAEKNNLPNLGDYFLAGLIHDIGKDVPILKQKEIVETFYKEYSGVEPKIYHQFVGEYLAKNDFGIKNPNILNAIKYHTTGRAGMSELEIVVYSADKIEPTRGFDSKWLINAIEVNLYKGFSTILKDNIRYFQANDIDYNNELTKACMKEFIID